MKKLLIGSLVGAVLVFGWQSTAHMLMHHHDAAYLPATNDASVLTALSANMKTEGQYLVPAYDPTATPEQQEAKAKEMEGKPWAIIQYHPAYQMNMGMAVLRGFITVLISVMIVMGIMGKKPGSFGTVFLKTLGAGLFAWLFVWYNYNIWMQTPWAVIRGELIDHAAAWSLCGLWLGYYLTRTPRYGR